MCWCTYLVSQRMDLLSVSPSTLRCQMWGSFCRIFQSTPTTNDPLAFVPRSQAARARRDRLPGSIWPDLSGNLGGVGKKRSCSPMLSDDAAARTASSVFALFFGVSFCAPSPVRDWFDSKSGSFVGTRRHIGVFSILVTGG